MVGFLFLSPRRASKLLNYTRSMRVSNQPNLPLITAASQKEQMLVMSTLTDAPQFGQVCDVIVPGGPVVMVDGRWKIQSSVQSQGLVSPRMTRDPASRS